MQSVYLETLALDELGRVVLSDLVLDQVEACDHLLLAGADGSTNPACTNGDCDGSVNGGCTNTSSCNGSVNFSVCQNPRDVPGG